MLPEYPHDHRPARAVRRWITVERRGARFSADHALTTLANHRELARRYFPVRARPRFCQTAPDRQFQRSSRSAAFRQFGGCPKTRASGNQLPRPFHPHKDSPAVRAVEPTGGLCRAAREDRRALKPLSRGVCRLLQSFAQPDSPAMRDPNPTVVLVPGHRHVQFWQRTRPRRESPASFTRTRFTSWRARRRFGSGGQSGRSAAGRSCREDAQHSRVHDNYVALPPSEAFRIEYWALEEAKIRRQPPEKELSRQILLVVGGGTV